MGNLMSSLQKRDTEIGLLPLYSERWKLKLWEGVVSTFYSEWWKRRLALIQDSTLSWTTETRSHLSNTHTFDHKHVILAPECLSNWVLGSNEHHKIYYSVAFVFLIHFLSFSFFPFFFLTCLVTIVFTLYKVTISSTELGGTQDEA